MIRTPIIRTIFCGPLEVPIMEIGLYMVKSFLVQGSRIAPFILIDLGSFNNYVTLGRVGGVNDFVTVRYENSAWVGGFRFILVRNAAILFHFPEANKFYTNTQTLSTEHGLLITNSRLMTYIKYS